MNGGRRESGGERGGLSYAKNERKRPGGSNPSRVTRGKRDMDKRGERIGLLGGNIKLLGTSIERSLAGEEINPPCWGGGPKELRKGKKYENRVQTQYTTSGRGGRESYPARSQGAQNGK